MISLKILPLHRSDYHHHRRRRRHSYSRHNHCYRRQLFVTLFRKKKEDPLSESKYKRTI